MSAPDPIPTVETLAALLLAAEGRERALRSELWSLQSQYQDLLREVWRLRESLGLPPS